MQKLAPFLLLLLLAVVWAVNFNEEVKVGLGSENEERRVFGGLPQGLVSRDHVLVSSQHIFTMTRAFFVQEVKGAKKGEVRGNFASTNFVRIR